MAVITADVVENEGLIKQFDDDSREMIMQIVQKDLYTKPIESSIRETFSNCFDAITEKKIAISILTGQSKVEDHFVTDINNTTKASRFNPAYYDLNFLDANENKVLIEYTERVGERDLISISDYGVGLANGRLEGYFSPGFSSKRLSINQLGKFGIGAKSPLATNIEFYVLETWYNGNYTKFMIYDNYFKCIVPSTNASQTTYIHGKRLVDGVIVDATEHVYWEASTEKNGVRVSFDVKKHNKDSFMYAVKDQLLYFKDSLIFKEIYSNGAEILHSTMFASIIHETKSLLISNNLRFTKPHILINNVNYGNVDFSELGINTKYGGIAIRAGSSDVDITASRESVKWTEKTRNFILNTIDSAAYEAGESLKELLSNIINPIDKYIQANSNTLNFAQSKNSEVIKQLKAFCGEVKLSIPVDITHLIDESIRKKLDIPNTIEINKAMQYVDGFTTIHNINVNGPKITASKGANLSAITMTKDCLFLVSNAGVRGLSTNIAHFWAKGNKTFQYVVFRNIEKPMLTKEEIVKAKITYKTAMRSYYLHKASMELFVELLNKYMVSVESLDREAISDYVSVNRIQDDSIITIKEDMNYSYTMSVRSEKVKKEEELKELKKSKVVLPFKAIRYSPYFFSGNILSTDAPRYGITPMGCIMSTIKQAEMMDVTSRVVYASTKDRELLEVLGFILNLRGLITSHFNEPGKFFPILISEENIKFFKQIPESMSVQELFKENHEVIDGYLNIKGGHPIRRFMTNLRLQQAMAITPSFYILSTNDHTVSHSFLAQLSRKELTEEEDLFNKISSIIREFPISKEKLEKKEIVNKCSEILKVQVNKTESVLNSLLETLENMTKLQDIPAGQEIEEEDLNGIVKSFKGYTVDFYDKEFVEHATALMCKYEELFLLCIERASVRGSSYPNKVAIDQIELRISERIEEFFNKLN